jgi:DNA-binding NarL/FixJ family response regulator
MTRVLLVDDHASARRSIRALLEEAGYEVVGEAADGRSALQQAQELDPDVVLLDIQLPDIDGFEVAARLAVGGRAPRVVLTSSRDVEDYGDLVAQAPARGFLAKDELTGEALAALLTS